MRKKFLLIGLVFLLILPACSSKTATPATPTVAAPTPRVLEKGMGTVTGTIMRKGTQPEESYADLRLFLGSLILDSNGKATIASVDANNDPQTRTDKDGNFEFINIKPGTYILAAQLPPVQIVKLKKGDGQELLINIAADQKTELGKLYYDFPFPEPETPAPYPPAQPPNTNTPTSYP